MSAFIDITGQRFGRWIVIERAANKHQKSYWQCRCNCGNEHIIQGRNLVSGASQSCGCLRRELITKHGMACDPIYKIWHGMLQRCTNSRLRIYQYYGGRGISVCERWKDFSAFYADMGERPSPQHSLDRINNDGNYEPGNVRWSLSIQQRGNQRPFASQNGRHRTNRLITAFGETLHLKEWVRRTAINRHTITSRLKHGWSAERALSAKARHHRVTPDT